ncbi:MAG: hypothetical protein OXE75_16545, partial [bacterium]|nr:hypothetical protein [bacterium]
WFQQRVCTGALAAANPKRLRWALWHTPGRLARRARRTIIRLPDNPPGATHLARIYRNMTLLC